MILIIKHIGIEGPGLIGDFFLNTNYSVKTIELGDGEALSENIDDLEAVIILGGPMNVYDEEKYPFLKSENAFIKKLLSAKVPILGICLGAQLIAKAAGAKITAGKYKEIGWHSVKLNGSCSDDPLFESLGLEIDVFQWHEDKFDIPSGATLLASSDKCPQAFRLGENVYGMQFHFEVTPKMILSWVKHYSIDDAVLGLSDVANMVVGGNNREDRLREFTNTICSRFSRIINDSRK